MMKPYILEMQCFPSYTMSEVGHLPNFFFQKFTKIATSMLFPVSMRTAYK